MDGRYGNNFDESAKCQRHRHDCVVRRTALRDEFRPVLRLRGKRVLMASDDTASQPVSEDYGMMLGSRLPTYDVAKPFVQQTDRRIISYRAR